MPRESRLPAVDLLRCMLTAREADRREAISFRQGMGWFQVPCSGHEALAAIAYHLRPDDILFPYYRDRALVQARGLSTEVIACDFLGNARSSSMGRVQPNHFSSRPLNIVSVISLTGSQCLPAVGSAWGIDLSRKGVLSPLGESENPDKIVLCTLGEGATREGEFYEAVCFAVQESLPIVFVVEDNGYCISTPTEKFVPFRSGFFPKECVVRVNGRDPREVYEKSGKAIAKARQGDGPTILWCDIDRLESHTSSDDQKLYRPKDDLEKILSADPIPIFAKTLVSDGSLSDKDWETMQADVRREVDETFQRVAAEVAPPVSEVTTKVFGPVVKHVAPPFQAQDARAASPYAAATNAQTDELTLAEAVNFSLRSALERFPKTMVFGQDVEDPKGGVFRLTLGLSSQFPGRVVNSPLSEATITGLGVGMGLAGYRPIFELQFIDFAVTGFNQLVSQAATMRWRTHGEWTCPLVIYAPYGAYTGGGGMWHSQSNDGWWAHVPGLRVAVPSTPEDAVGLFWSAFQDEDPTLVLIPKHLAWERMPARPFVDVPFGRASVRREGEDVTVVSWGSCVKLAEKAAETMAESDDVSVEVIDLRSLVPCDWTTVENSLKKTGRLVVVHEDNLTCGFGQAVVSEMTTHPERFDLLLSHPRVVARPNVQIPYRPDLERAVLPNVAQVIEAVCSTLE